MAEGINVAILKGLIQMDYDPGKLATFLDQLTLAKAKQISAKTEGDRLKASFDKLAASLDPVVARTQKYNQSVDTLNKSLKAGIITQAQYNTHLAQAKQRLQDTTTWTQRLGAEVGGNLQKHFASLINPTTLAIGAIAGIGATVVSITKQIITASIEAEKSQNQVAFAVEHYGDRAGVTVKQIDDLATAQSRLTGADDEEIASAAALALRFNRLSGDDLPRLIAVAQDMAVVLGIDIPSATDKAAAYINLPVQALTRLKKEGYAVSEAQSKLVKDFIRVGDVASAQGVILKILESQYGGAAIAARDTLGGAFKALGTTWENLLEKMGEDSTGPLREGIESLIRVIISLTDHVDDLTIGFLNAKIAVNVFTSNALTGLANTVDVLSKAAPLLGILGVAGKKLADTANLSARARAGAAAADKNAEDAAKALMNALLGVNDAGKKGKGVASELTEAESKLNDQLKKQREEWQKLLEVAANAVLASQDELANTQALLQARKIGIDAMKLEQTVQSSLAKAKQAGKAATSEQRLEIIRNSIATFQAKNAIEDLGEVEKRVADLFAESSKEMLRQVGILADLEAATRDLASASVEINTSQVSTGGDQATQVTHERVDFANQWRESWKTASEVAQEEIDRVNHSILSTIEKERALGEIRDELLSTQLQGWSQFFSILGSMFGGFVQKVSTTLSQMIQTAQAFQSAGNAIGGQAGSAISSAGPFMAIVGAIVGLQSAEIARTRQRQYTSSATLGFGGSSGFSTVGSQGLAVANGIEAGLKPLLDLLGRTLRSLPEITIQARADGKEFQAVFNNVLLGFFGTMDEAMDAVSLAAVEWLKQGGALSETMKKVLEASKATTSEQLLKDLNFADWYDELGLGELVGRFKELFRTLQQSLDDADRLGLEQAKIWEDFQAKILDLKAGVLGLDLSASKALENLLGLSQAIRDTSNQEREAAQHRLDLAQQALSELQTSGPRTGPFGRTESQESFDRALADLQSQVDRYVDILGKIPDALSNQEIDLGIWTAMERFLQGNAKYAEEAAKFARMRVQIEFDLIKLKLIELGKWEEWASVFNDAFNSAMQSAGQAGRIGRGGGHNQDRDSILGFLGDRELALMGDLSGQLAGLNDQYKDEIKSAGKNKDLIAQLVAMREREVAALRDQTRAQLLTPYLGGANAGARSDFDRQRLDINRAYDDYRANAHALGEAIWKINAAEAERLRLLGLEAASSAGSKTASTILEFQNLGQTISFLRSNAKKLGVDFNKLMTELQGEQLVSFGDRLLSFVDKYYGDSAGFEQFRMDLERTRFELEVANMKLQFKLLGDLGLLSEKTIAEVGKIFGFIDSHPVDWGKFVNNDKGIRFKGYDDSLATSVSNVTDNLNQLAESFKSAKDDIRSTLDEISRGGLGIVAPEVAFAAATEQYDATIRSAKSGELIGFQKASEVAKNYIEALKTFSPALASVSLPSIQEDLKTLLAAPNVRDENVIFSERFGEFTTAQEKASALLETGFTAVTNVSQKQTEIQSQMLGQLTELNRSNAELNARLSRLESGNQGNKREVA